MNGIPPKPAAKDDFQKPVSWLVGRDLIAGLKWIALFTAFKGKLDPRDWMTPRAFPRFVAPERVLRSWRTRNDRNWRWRVTHDTFWAEEQRRWEAERTPEQPQWFWQRHQGTAEEDFWFDYISDSGDGQLATYNVAYLCLSDLWVARDPAIGSEVSLRPSPERPTLLPRGQFLFVGGDTAYHIADYTSLSTRFQAPFRWAFASLRHWLRREGRLREEPDAEGRVPHLAADGSVVRRESEPTRPLFGVPGNHDYYDLLDGFNRQFRRPSPGVQRLLGRPPQLSVLGFTREQDASYVAVQMPFRWWFWGLDTEISKLDTRQQIFFAKLNRGQVPDKLVFATPEPTTVFRRRKAVTDEHALQALEQLGLRQPDFPEDAGESGRCRLDLSGDVHHYARYYGPNTKGLPAAPKRSSDHYASIVAGGGGAFHHPSETHVAGPDAVEEQVLFPPADRSRAEVAPRLFDLRNIWHGGYVWLFGMIIAGVLYFAANVPQTSRDILEWLFLDATGRPRELFWLSPVPFVKDPGPPGFPPVRYTSVVNLEGFILPTLLLLAALGCVAFGVALFARYIRRLSDYEVAAPPAPAEAAAAAEEDADADEEDEEDAEADATPPPPGDLPVRYRDLWPVGLCVLAALVLYLAGVWRFVAARDDLHPFGASLLVAAHLLLAGGFVALAVQNSSWLAHRPKFHVGTEWRYLPVWALNVLAAAAALFGVWTFGGGQAAYVLSDIIFALVVVGVMVSLTLIGTFVAGKLQRAAGKALLTLVGFWHALLQLVVPLLLVRVGDWRAVLWALFFILLFSGVSLPFTRVSVPGVGALLMRRRTPLGRALLLAAWFVYGAILLYLPFRYHDRARLPGGHTSYLPQGAVDWLAQLFAPSATAGAWAVFVVSLATAVLLGFLLSMSWLSWYFGVALSFQGHNNEAGGAARIEAFKHIVRIRLTNDTLTAYVVGLEEPAAEGSDLRLKLVDCFRLRVTP